MGTLRIRIPILGEYTVGISTDVSHVDILLFVMLDVLMLLRKVLCIDSDKLISKHDDWSLLLTRKHGHLYVE